MTAPESISPTPAHPVTGNILLTDAEGIATYANEGIAARTGFSVGEIIDSKPGKLWGGRMPRRFYRGMWQTLRDERSVFVGTVTNQSKGGQPYRELLAVAPLEGSDGSVQYLALRPPHIEDAPQFVSEWKRVFNEPRVQTSRALPWFRRWFPSESESADDPRPAEGLFSDWIVRHWVNAFQDRFRRRIDDRPLIEAAKADPREFQALYEKYFETIERYFMCHLPGNRDQALDLTQDTFIRAFERLDGYETRNAAYGTYLLRIAHSILINSFRRQSFVELPAEQAAPTSASSGQADWIWETPELSVRERVVLSAYYREGYSVREISAHLGHSENATKLLLSRARKKLRPLFAGS